MLKKNIGHLLVKKWNKKCLCASALPDWARSECTEVVLFCGVSILGKMKPENIGKFSRFLLVKAFFPPSSPTLVALRGPHKFDSTADLLQMNSVQWAATNVFFCVKFCFRKWTVCLQIPVAVLTFLDITRLLTALLGLPH